MPMAGKKWTKAHRAAFERTMALKKRTAKKKTATPRAGRKHCPWCGQAMKD